MNEQKKLSDARQVLAVLEDAGCEARFAGGCVRDRLMGRVPKDYDAATTARPEDVCRIFEQKSYRVIPTGLDHGTVTVVTRSGPVEVTTLRFDVETDGRHAAVAFDKATFEDDAARRDFTVNAMFEDKEGKVYDFFGGQEDIKKRQLRFVGDARERIREDYLRIMRLFRFWARLEFNPDTQSMAAVRAEVGGLKQISIERITSELMLMFACGTVAEPLAAMRETGTLGQILNFAADATPQDVATKAIEQMRHIATEWRAMARLATLCKSTLPGVAAKTIGEHFKLSRAQIKQLELLINAATLLAGVGDSPADHMQFIDIIEEAGGAGAFTKLLVPYAEVMQITPTKIRDLAHTEATKGHLRTAQLPIDGRDLMLELGIQQGAELGVLLGQLKHSFRNGAWRTRDEGLAKAKALR